jgi:hypothetical protein
MFLEVVSSVNRGSDNHCLLQVYGFMKGGG